MATVSTATISRILGGTNDTKGKKKSKSKASVSQAAAARIFTREQLAGKRSRLECLLFQQYSKAFGRNDVIKAQIKRHISDFVNSQDDFNFSEAKIATLEAQVRQLALAAAQQRRQAASTETSTSATKADVVPSLNATAEAPRASQVPQIEPDWSILSAILTIKEEEKEAATRKEDELRKKKFRVELDEQLQHLRVREEEDKRAKQVLLEQSHRVQREFEVEQRRVQEERERKLEFERRVNQEQMDLVRQRREEERAQRIREERASMERSRLLAEEEERIKAERKEKSRLAMERVIVENERNKAIRVQQKIAEGEYEAKLQREYA